MRRVLTVIPAGDSPLHRAIWRAVSSLGFEITPIDSHRPAKYDPILVEPGFSAGKCCAPRSPKDRKADVEAARFAHRCRNRFIYFCPFTTEEEPDNPSGRGVLLAQSVPELLSRLATRSYEPIDQERLQQILRPAASRTANRIKHDVKRGKPDVTREARDFLRQVQAEQGEEEASVRAVREGDLSGRIPSDLSTLSDEELIQYLEEVNRECR